MPIPASARSVRRSLAREAAYEQLKDWIVDGTLSPGEVLRDQAIAQRLAVSRTPIREALRRLEDEGFVETALNRWTRVAPLNLTKALDTYSVIEALESFALEKSQLSPQDLKRMAQANHSMQRAIRLKHAASTLTADEVFHAVWLERAGNPELFDLVRQLKTKLRRVELAYWGRAMRTVESVREHAAILRALQTGSRRAAVNALKHNWEGAKQRLQTVVENLSAATD